MKTKILNMESKWLGAKVLHLSNWTTVEELILAEPNLIALYNPGYMYCEVESTQIDTIHKLEETGYRFSEFRVKSNLNTTDLEYGSSSFYPYIAELIGDPTQLTEAISMLKAARDDDRFSNDPALSFQFSKKRVIYNLNKSFRSYPKEFVLGVFNTQTKKLIGFRSGVFLSKSEVQYYQYAVDPLLDFNQIASILESLTIDFLKYRGIEIIYAVTTGFNIDELNRLVKNHEFTIKSSSILMRKIYKPKTKL